MDVQIKRHPGVCRDPGPGDLLDSRVRGNDHCPVNTLCGVLGLRSYATCLALRGSPARAVAEFNKRKRLSAPGIAHEMPEMVEFTPRVAAVVRARYAHTAKRAGLASWCQRYPEPVQDGKDVFAVQRHQGDAPGWEL